MICNGKSVGTGISLCKRRFVLEKLLLLCMILFLNAKILGKLKKASLKKLSQRTSVRAWKVQVFKADMERYLIFWEDLKCFPVAGRINAKTETFSYENSWHEKRHYGGERLLRMYFP